MEARGQSRRSILQLPPGPHDRFLDTPIFEDPAPTAHATVMPSNAQDAVLDPFALYEKQGETLLRRQLAAHAAWHLVNIVKKYELSDEAPATLHHLSAAALIERFVSSVRSQRAQATRHA
jgi:hypothetical protein